MANKKDLKSYARFDGSGRIIPSSNVLRRKMPKGGNWYEGPAYLCCNPTPVVHTPICVSGFVANSGFNGTYTYVSISLGKPHYTKDSGLYDVYWDGTKWVIGNVAYSENNVANPTLVTIWMGLPVDGAISVVTGDCSSTTTTTTTAAATTTTTTSAR